jgi:hypothetical protein
MLSYYTKSKENMNKRITKTLAKLGFTNQISIFYLDAHIAYTHASMRI